MSTTTRRQRRYDHRLKELVRTTGDVQIARESGVPRSTAYGWLNRSRGDVVSLDVHDDVTRRRLANENRRRSLKTLIGLP